MTWFRVQGSADRLSKSDQVLHISSSRTGVIDVYVTDYTSNPEIPDDDRLLAYHPQLKGNKIIEATFWDDNAAEAQIQGLKAGDFVFLRNAHSDFRNGTIKVNLRSSVRGKQGSIDVGQSWKILNITNPLVVEILR